MKHFLFYGFVGGCRGLFGGLKNKWFSMRLIYFKVGPLGGCRGLAAGK